MKIKQGAYRARFEYYYLENERPFLFSMKNFQSNLIKYDKKFLIISVAIIIELLVLSDADFDKRNEHSLKDWN